MSDITLRLGRYQDVMQDVECDLCLTDPPYSERTHGSYRQMAEVNRRAIEYAAWSPDAVQAFVQFWHERTRGWIVALTDHELIPAWQAAFSAVGRYAFAPPYEQTRRGACEGNGIMGGKPTALMRELVKDYSREQGVVCDPCAGGATTLIAAALEGRRAIGAELDPDTHAKAMLRIERGNAGLRSPNQGLLPL